MCACVRELPWTKRYARQREGRAAACYSEADTKCMCCVHDNGIVYRREEYHSNMWGDILDAEN